MSTEVNADRKHTCCTQPFRLFESVCLRNQNVEINFGRTEYIYTVSMLTKCASELDCVVDAPLVEVIGLN
jgi:hypothetical protein